MFGPNNTCGGQSNSMNYMSIPGVLKDMTREEIKQLRKLPQVKVATFIMSQISQLSGVSLENARGRNRTREFVKARQMMMYYMEVYVDISQKDIGELICKEGHFDHTTVIYARNTIKDLLTSQALDKYTVDVHRINDVFINNLKEYIRNESNSINGQGG